MKVAIECFACGTRLKYDPKTFIVYCPKCGDVVVIYEEE